MLTKNLRRKGKDKKLKSIKIEAFFIKKIKRFKNYALNLSKNVKIHSIFDISLLKSIDLDTIIQETFRYDIQKEDEFDIKTTFEAKKSKIPCKVKKIRYLEKHMKID